MKGEEFLNWGKTVNCTPSQFLLPKSEGELVEIINIANKNKHHIRVVGSGHSWTPLVETNDVLICLDLMQGLMSHDDQQNISTAWAGTKLNTLTELLYSKGVAMENMGDIDKQSLAGALSTGTHGTGINFGILANQVHEFTFINGRGHKQTVKRETDTNLFKALQVSLGSFGLITQMALKTVPCYILECKKEKIPLEDCLKSLDSFFHNNRNFEFFWFPYSEIACAKSLNISQKQPIENKLKDFFVDIVYENGTFKIVSELSKTFPQLSKSVSKLCADGISNSSTNHYAHKVYATPRLVRFYEMEYSVPIEEGPIVLRKIKKMIEDYQIAVHFPIEYRCVKKDDILISPAHGRDSAYIAVHMYLGMKYEYFFREAEKIFLAHNGRPHWGKMHFLTGKQLSKLYPKWNDFVNIQKEQDPEGIFMNDYLKSIFTA